MRTNVVLHSCRVAMALVCVVFVIQNGHAQGTAFTYQGQLMNNGQPANGNFDLTFSLFPQAQDSDQVGPTVTNLNTPVSAGLFTVTVDFGAVFNGLNYWLQIGVRTNGNGPFTALQPRQLLTPTPYAIYSANASTAEAALTADTAASASSVPAAGIVGTIPSSNLTSAVSWQTPSSTNFQAQPNTAYLVTSAQPVTIKLPASPNVGDTIEIAGVGVGGWILNQNPGQTILASFTPVVPIGGWASVASSADGTKLAAAGTNGIWVSTNSGTNWEQTPVLVTNWISITSSSDGTKLAAGEHGEIWTSTNTGSSWTQASASSNVVWASIASSSDGTHLAAVAGSGGDILTSTNSGSNWTLFVGVESWTSIASSADGTKLAVASIFNNGGIWTSTNAGSNWTQTSAPTVNWPSITSSADGTKLAAAAMNSGIWTSTNAGSNWMQTSAPNLNWVSIACSSNGIDLAAAAQGAGIWTSTNLGTNWVQVPTLFPENWTSVASSSDGTQLVATIANGGIWTFTNGVLNTQSASPSGSTTVGTNGFLQGSAGTVIKLLYLGNGQFMTINQTGVGTFSGH